MQQDKQQLIKQAYEGFNARNIDSVLALMDENVQWPNGWEGGYVHGHPEVRSYWTRQWKEIDPVVTPVSFHENPQGQLEVEVRQVVKDQQGNLLADSIVYHVYSFSEGKVKRMEIKSALP
jgi:hypothetical protein